MTVIDPDTLVGDVTFADLGLAPPLLDALREAGYERPTPIQREAIPLALTGRDLIGLAQTGTGKTASFTLPMVHRLLGGPRRTRVLVLTPTRRRPAAARLAACCAPARFRRPGLPPGPPPEPSPPEPSPAWPPEPPRLCSV